MANKATDYLVRSVKEHRGAPRLYLDGLDVVRAGFSPGDRFDIEVDGHRVTLSLKKDGSRTVSPKKRGDKVYPVVDINSKELLKAFEGMEAVRVVVRKGEVVILPLASEVKKRERLDRLKSKLENAERLAMGSLSHGGGVLSHAIHAGLIGAGIQADLVFANEIRDDLVNQAKEHNSAWTEETMALVAPMQEVAQDEWLMQQLPKLEILEMGLPCSGASRAGKSKRGLEMMEDHPEVGHLVYSALVILNKTQPVVVLLENVPEYADSASAQILRYQLRDMGYQTHEAILEGRDFGCLENRVRWCMVATTKGMDFSFENIEPKVKVVRRLKDVLENIAPDDPRWRTFDYLKTKQVRDKEKGNGFGMQIVNPEDTKVPTIRKGYHKGGSTDPLLKHPTNDDLLRLFTGAEHARIKGVPEKLVEGLSDTTIHELLGQGVLYDPFESVGQRIGEAIGKIGDAESGALAETSARKMKATG